jgi:hypothetical protein
VVFFGTDSGKDTAGGAALGDVDGDGLPDILLPRSEGGSRLYRNLGDFRFEDRTEAAGLLDEPFWSTGATLADIDLDGDLDIYACAHGQPNRLYVNDGRGRFEEKAGELGLAFRGASVLAAFADVDLDGDLDVYLLTTFLDRPGWREGAPVKVDPVRREATLPPEYRELLTAFLLPDGRVKAVPSGQYDHLYRNDGPTPDGRIVFTEVTREAGMESPAMGLSATWWDYNGDGRPDLYVANDFHGPDHLYRNDSTPGAIRFTDVSRDALPSTPWYSMGSDAGDVNNDGLLDYLATDMAGTTHYKDKIGMGDMEDSGWFLELAEPRQHMRNCLYVNTGTGRFLEAAQLAGLARTDWTWAAKLGDLDQDGRLDVFITNGMTRDLFNSDLKAEEKKVMERRDLEAAAAFWRDKPVKKDVNFAFRNLGDLRFEETGAAWGLAHLGVSFGAAFGDLDADGDLDIVVNNYGEPAAVYRNRSPAERHAIRVRLRGTASPSWGIGATVRLRAGGLEQMRYLTVERGYMAADEPVLHFGLGGEVRVERLEVEWPSGRRQRFEDLAADRLYTITEPGDEASPRGGDDAPAARAAPLFERAAILAGAGRKEREFDDFAREPLLPNRLSRLGPGLAWGDIDGDGDDDLYLGGSAGNAGALHVNEGGGRFVERHVAAFAEDREREDMAPLFLDADLDGDQDLYVVSGSTECEPESELLRDRLYVNDGAGGFARAPADALPDLRTSGSVACAADFDRDGDLDIFAGGRCIPGRYPLVPESHLLVNGGGRFTLAGDDVAPGLRRAGLVTSALWSDADGDGWTDLLVACEWGPVRLFRNEEGTLRERTLEAGLARRLGWWHGIAGGDVDGDDDNDYAVTGFGLNTKYKASPEEPELLYYGDLDGSGRPQIVEAKFEGEVCYPRRGLSCSSAAMPAIRERLKTFHDFASAPLAGIYAPGRLAEAARLEANTLESGILIADGGRFRFSPLPRLAQIAPAFGVVLADLDIDGALDLALAQNFFWPERETGRLNGGVGLFLSGDGRGRFEPLWPERSGVLIPGDARGLTTADADGDGRLDLVAAVNDGDPVVLANRARTGGRFLLVRLRGRPGNPTAAGAVVRIERDGASALTAEVHAGGGYLSQSSSRLAFGLGTAASARAVRVRWPSGRLSTHPVPGGALEVTVVEP